MISLPIINTEPMRPAFALGPRTLQAVKLLRVSVTDRCNLRCIYCMPEDGVEWMSKQSEMLTPHEFEEIALAAADIGVSHIKITGGEPTVRSDVVEIAQRIGRISEITDLSFTTNGLLFARYADDLRTAGVRRITFSCDSLNEKNYTEITQGGRIKDFWRGIEAADSAGFVGIKINMVPIPGLNDHEIEDFAELTIKNNWTIRFIEFMPLGDTRLARQGHDDVLIDCQNIKERITKKYGKLQPVERKNEPGVGPAQVYKIPGSKGRIGFISAMSQPFCEHCNRLRLTAIGELRSCLFDGGEVSLLPALRPRPDRNRIIDQFAKCVTMKPDLHAPRGNRPMSQIGG